MERITDIDCSAIKSLEKKPGFKLKSNRISNYEEFFTHEIFSLIDDSISNAPDELNEKHESTTPTMMTGIKFTFYQVLKNFEKICGKKSSRIFTVTRD